MSLFGDKPEAGLLIDGTGGVEEVVGPERNLPVSLAAGEGDALVDELPAETETAGGPVDIEQAELCNAIATIGDQHRAQIDAAALGDPAIFHLGIETGEELAGDVGDQPLEAQVPAIFLGIETSLALDDPADIAGAMRADDGGCRFCLRVEDRADRSHGGNGGL